MPWLVLYCTVVFPGLLALIIIVDAFGRKPQIAGLEVLEGGQARIGSRTRTRKDRHPRKSRDRFAA